MDTCERSYKSIRTDDLNHLARIAEKDRRKFFSTHPKYKAYARRVICVCLCQDAALHFVHGKRGIKDFDVWTFYAALPSVAFPYRRRKPEDFGPSRFGRHPDDVDYVGRRVDLLGRSLHYPLGIDPQQMIHDYLTRPKTRSAQKLAKKAVVLLWPKPKRKVLWRPIRNDKQ